MFIIIESTIGGTAAGYVQCGSLTGDEELKSLIAYFCATKEVPVNPDFILRDTKGLILDSRKTISECGIENGATLYLESYGMQNEIFAFTNWWALAFGAVLLAAIGLAIIITLRILKGPTPKEFGIVLDAGSSHTSLYVYQWDGPKWQGTGVLKETGSCYIDGDVGRFYKNISNVDTYLSNCLSYATDHVPVSSRNTAPIFFGATAGLRLLNISHPEGTQVLLDGIRNDLSQSGFKFDRSYAEILTGKEEAEFSWITVNTLLHHLGPNDTLVQQTTQSSTDTVGAMDLGGASTQIAVEVPVDHVLTAAIDSNDWNPSFRTDHITDVELYGRNYTVFTQSSLCYGIMEVIRRYQSIIIHEAGEDESEIDSPCQPLGYSSSVTSDYIYGSPCTANASSVMTHVRPASVEGRRQWVLNGTSDYAKCAVVVEHLFNSTYCHKQFMAQTCFSNQNLPALDHQNFMAFSTFYLVADSLNITNQTTLSQFRQSVAAVCNLTWDQVEQLPLDDPYHEIAQMLCLESQYVLSLLTTGYSFDDDSWQRIYFTNRVAATDVGWTMGYMTEKSSEIEAVDAKELLSLPAFTGLIVLFCLFFLIGCLMTYHAFRMNQTSDSYNRLNRHTYGSLTLSL